MSSVGVSNFEEDVQYYRNKMVDSLKPASEVVVEEMRKLLQSDRPVYAQMYEAKALLAAHDSFK
ncbi:hypothetical protein [Paenibacillus elgii]|uniref:hypothetical protein n=1 Tax=Paenibacillus elgii TaxID=189691 RepID=UPI000248E083|nr:hypothetical protein [Paenibacillus elgii]